MSIDAIRKNAHLGATSLVGAQTAFIRFGFFSFSPAREAEGAMV
jgi:hypothetical protein